MSGSRLNGTHGSGGHGGSAGASAGGVDGARPPASPASSIAPEPRCAGDGGLDGARSLSADLASDEPTLGELAERHGVPVDELAAELADRTSAARRSIARLADAQSALLPAVLGRAKLLAARRLRQLAEGEEHPETARKASLDLLKLTPGLSAPACKAGARHRNLRQANGPDAALTSEAEQAIRALLESMSGSAGGGSGGRAGGGGGERAGDEAFTP